MLADSSVVHPDDPAGDGRRLVMACADAHLTRLQAAGRPWRDEELWAGQLARANRGHHRCPLPLPVLAR